MAEDLDCAARNERRPSEERHAQLFGGTEEIGNRKRNARRQAPSGQLLDELEHAALRGVFSAERVPRAHAPAFERLAVSGGDVIHVGARPPILWSDQTRQPVFQVVRHQTADLIGLGERSRSVDYAGVDANDRTAVAHGLVSQTIGGHLGSLVIIRLQRLFQAARR